MEDSARSQTVQPSRKRELEQEPREIEVQKAQAEFWASIQTVMSLQQGLPALKPVETGKGVRLSYAEERLWILNEYRPTAALNIPFTLRLRGELHKAALEQSLTDLWNRHEVLRTQYRQTQDGPIRIVNAPQSYPLHVHELSHLPKAARSAKARELATQAAQQPFQLSEDPLLRVSLLRLETQEHWLLITLHHIVFDGWSEGILFRELSDLYRSHVAGAAPALPGLPIQYGDYGEWQRNSLGGDYRDALLGYWQQQMKHGLAEQQMPLDQLRTPDNKSRSAVETFQIAAPLTEQLKAFSRQEKVTLFVTLLAAFKVLLYRYTDQERIYVCTPSANRTRTETKRLIGYFVNLLILQTDLRGNPSVVELVHRVRQVVSGAFAYQDLPMQVLIEEMNLGNAQIAQVMFALQNTPKQTPALLDLAVERLEVDNGFIDFDLFLSIAEEDKELVGTLKYNAELYTDETIRRLLGHYQNVLEGIVANPESPLTSPRLLNVEIVRRSPSPSQELGAAAPRQDYVPPRTTIEQKLIEIWQSVLGIQPVGVRDNFFQLGGNSLSALSMFNKIKVVFNKNLALSTLFQAPTVEALARTLAQENLEGFWSSLVPIQTQGTKPPLFCVHGLRGNVLHFQNLSETLGPEQPFYGLQAQGLDDTQPPLTTIEEMAALYIQEIRTIQAEGPYFLSGHSGGGVIAFEMAHQLLREGQAVALVALSDTYGPIYYQPASLMRLLKRHYQNLVRLNFKRKCLYLQHRCLEAVASYRETLRDLIKPILSTTTKRPPADDLINPALIKAGQQALKTYVPPVYPGKVLLFRAKYQPWQSMSDRDLGWRRFISGDLEIFDIPGSHVSIILKPLVTMLAEKLADCMEQEQSKYERSLKK